MTQMEKKCNECLNEGDIIVCSKCKDNNFFTGLEDIMIDDNKKQRVADWKLFQRGNFIDIRCSHCFNTRVEAYAYNYHIYELTMEDKKEIMKFIEDNHMNYCECCGAKMRYKI